MEPKAASDPLTFGEISLILAKVGWGVLLIPLGFLWACSYAGGFTLSTSAGASWGGDLVLSPIVLCSVTAVYLLVAARLHTVGRVLSSSHKKVLVWGTVLAIAAEVAFPPVATARRQKVEETEEQQVRTAIAQYLEKVSHGQFDEAWQSLSPKRKREVSLDAFRAQWTRTLGDPPARLSWSFDAPGDPPFGGRCILYRDHAMCDVEVRVEGAGAYLPPTCGLLSSRSGHQFHCEQVLELTFFVLKNHQIDDCGRFGGQGNEGW